MTQPQFARNVHRALEDSQLQKALHTARPGFIAKRAAAGARLPEFEALRDSARDIKAHTLAHLDLYLEAYEKKVTGSGGVVHYARTAEAANEIVLGICRRHGATRVVKGKTMIGEEIGVNAALEANGIDPVETDLGEYIIQLRRETPSHIIAPAVHLSKEQVAADFRRAHLHLPDARDLTDAKALLAEARGVLREKFLVAEVGITGANFLVAETGASIIVTNEGNGDLAETLPNVHIVLASIEKLVPTLEDVAQLLRVLARSATGQDMSVYTTFATGPRRADDPDGPREYHVVLLDNGRSAMLGSDFAEVLRCIRCGACMNHCPVYQSIGGHAYGSVYPGPMGAVMTPSLVGIEEFDRPAERLHLLRGLRKRLPGANPLTEDDAALARARLRTPPRSRAAALRPRLLGVLRQAPNPLSDGDPGCDGRSRLARQRKRALQVATSGEGLDGKPRFSCP